MTSPAAYKAATTAARERRKLRAAIAVIDGDLTDARQTGASVLELARLDADRCRHLAALARIARPTNPTA